MTGLVGRDLGRYHVVEQLGEGGMASVFKAYDTRLERYVAIKVILTAQQESENFLKRFEREAKALARLTHSNIVGIIDYGEDEGIPYLVMEYLPGGTLKHRMTGKPIPYQEAANLLSPVARALAYAHRHQIIHRDVKPPNILITESGTPMLSDFGIAKILSDTSKTDLTGTGVGIGTPDYMSPEQGKGEKVDHRSDIYSLGVIFYELVVGRRPFTADTPMALIFKHALEPLPRPKNFVPDLPDEVEGVIYKALAKNPDDRYQDMDAFAAALEALARSAPTVQIAAYPSAAPDAVTQVSLPPSQPSIGDVVTKINTQPPPPPPVASKAVNLGTPPSQPSISEAVTKVSTQPLPPPPSQSIIPLDEVATRVGVRPLFPPDDQAATRVAQATATIAHETAAPPAKPALQPAPKPKKKTSPWLWIGGIGVLVVILLIAAGSIILLANPFAASATPTEVAQAPTQTPQIPTSTQPVQPTPEPTQTNAPKPTESKPVLTQVSGGDGKPDCQSPDVYCIGLVLTTGGLDNPFNHATWEALQLAQAKLNAVVQFRETGGQNEYTKNAIDFAEQGFDVVVTIGSNNQQITHDLALKFDKTLFIGVDQPQEEHLNNLKGIIFPEDQAGFLVGALAAMMSKTNSLCGVYGPDIVPPVWRYGEGYRAGAQYINPKIGIASVYSQEGDLGKAFSDPGWGKQVSYDLIAKTQCDVLFAAAGLTGNGALEAAAEKKIYAIGVDIDQYMSVPDFVKPFLLSSAVKDIPVSLFNLLELARNGQLPPNTNFLGSANYAPFHDLENQVPDKIRGELERIRQGLRDGSIKTGVKEAKP